MLITFAYLARSQRGDRHHDSDIDFLVDFEPGRSLLDLAGLLPDLETCRVARSMSFPAAGSSRVWHLKRCAKLSQCDGLKSAAPVAIIPRI